MQPNLTILLNHNLIQLKSIYPSQILTPNLTKLNKYKSQVNNTLFHNKRHHKQPIVEKTQISNSVQSVKVSTVQMPKISISSPSTPSKSSPSCVSIPNSIGVGQNCLCKIGYINISSHCVPLSELTLLVIDPSKTVKASSVCPSDQYYSQTNQKCLCK